MKYLKCEKGFNVDVKGLDSAELDVLCSELREAILTRVSTHGGHCGSNLGFVEGTVALHRVFTPSRDRLVFDVSHQSYAHKILTGRAHAFLSSEFFGDITGYTNPHESDSDVFITGHTSTSLSTSLGLAIGRDRKGSSEKIVAIIGDGSLSGGLALEALDAIGEYRGQLLVIVNDNDMSISENHGGMYRHLAELRRTKGRSANNIFRSFGLDYEYLDEGNDVHKFISILEKLSGSALPVVLHVHTVKGCGYQPAIDDKESFHFKMPFDIKSGRDILPSLPASLGEKTYQRILALIKSGAKLQVLNAATASTLAMDKSRREALGAHYTDFGIAEANMVSSAAGIAASGAIPVVPVYSTFLHRAYDQIYHDVCVNALPVVFIVFSASIFGMRDVTHNGHFSDIPLSNLPNLTLLCPASEDEYFKVLDAALSRSFPAAVAIKVPENPLKSNYCAPDISSAPRLITQSASLPLSSSSLSSAASTAATGKKSVAIIAVGDTLATAEKACEFLQSKGVSLGLFSSLVTSPDFDADAYKSLFESHDLVAILEHAPLYSGFASKLAILASQTPCRLLPLSYPNKFTDGYDPDAFLSKHHLDTPSIASAILDALRAAPAGSH